MHPATPNDLASSLTKKGVGYVFLPLGLSRIRYVHVLCECFNILSISIITYSQTSVGYSPGYEMSRMDLRKTAKLSSMFQI